MTRPRTNQTMFQHKKTSLTSIVLVFVQGATLFNNDSVTLVYTCTCCHHPLSSVPGLACLIPIYKFVQYHVLYICHQFKIILNFIWTQTRVHMSNRFLMHWKENQI